MNFAICARPLALALAAIFLASCASNEVGKPAPDGQKKANEGYHQAWINM